MELTRVAGGPAHPRRWRPDGLAPAAPRGSGRRAVGAIVAAALTLWIGLGLAFRGWEARYRARAEFGASEVAPAVDPLSRLAPPGVDPAEWRSAVADTHAMLLALAGSGVLDDSALVALRGEVAARVARARPETARRELAGLWDDLERRAGPVIAPDRAPPPPNSRHAARHPRPPRPAILGPSPASSSASGTRRIGTRPGTRMIADPEFKIVNMIARKFAI